MLNNVNVIGRIGKDIELRRTQSGKAVTQISLACERDFKSQSGEKETDWLDVVVWSQSAEYLERYAHKGDLIAVSGRLQVRQWKDRDGNNRYSTEIVAREAYIVRSKDGSSGYSAPSASQQASNRDALSSRMGGVPAGPGDFEELGDDEDGESGELPF